MPSYCYKRTYDRLRSGVILFASIVIQNISNNDNITRQENVLGKYSCLWYFIACQMASEDETWAQTLITVTPEDDATLREISDTATLSSPSDTPLILNPDQIVYRRSLTHRQFIDAKESEDANDEAQVEELEDANYEEQVEESEDANDEEQVEEPEAQKYQDAENQTYLQGVPVVDIPVERTDKSSQTMYMAAPCPPLKYFKDIMTTMHDGPIPEMKKTNVAATILSFHPATPQSFVTEQLSANVAEEKLEEFVAELGTSDKAETEVTDILHFLLSRVFWIIDPSRTQAETIDKDTQTFVRFNNHTQILFVDNQAQTDLTCEPKKSNTMLLSDYRETKSMILNYLEDCFSKGLEAVAITDDIINEIVDKCAERIRYPMKEQDVQTIATYKLNEKKEDVLKKLKLEVIVDPLEASIIIVPLFTDLLQTVCDTVSRNAVATVDNVLQQILRRTTTIITKLIKLQTASQPRRMDEILEKRRKKIIDSMSRKETETISTQTSVTGILEVKRIEKSKEILCSVCRRQSMCQWCITDQEAEDISRQEVKILRTQDILLAYKPCYVITTASQKKENLQPVCQPEIKTEAPAKLPESTDESQDTIDVFLQAKKTIKPQESFNEWSYLTDATLMKPCSIKASTNSISQTTLTSISKSCKNSSRRHSTLTSQAATALQILKDIFCNQENCVTSSLQTLKQAHLSKDEKICKSLCTVCSSRNNVGSKISNRETFCTRQTCKAFSKLYLSKTNSYDTNTASRAPIKSCGDGFKIIPICLSQDSNT